MSATVAELQARAEATGGTFTFVETVDPPNTGGGNAPFQPAHPLQRQIPHVSGACTLLSWSAVYRTHVMPGYALLVDTAIASNYVSAVLDHAKGCFDSWDLRDSIPFAQTGFPQPGTGFQGS